jgi:hypothetical protein
VLELESAISTGSLDQGQRATAGGTRVAAEIDLLAVDELLPVVLEQLGELRQFGLLDQEVRLGPSTLAGCPGGTTDLDRHPCIDAAIAQSLHVGDRARHRRDQLHHHDLASLSLEPGSSSVTF